MDISLLHSRVLLLLDYVTDKYHLRGICNLYKSTAFSKACYKYSKKVLIQGMCRRDGRGSPHEVVQQDVSGKKAQ